MSLYGTSRNTLMPCAVIDSYILAAKLYELTGAWVNTCRMLLLGECSVSQNQKGYIVNGKTMYPVMNQLDYDEVIGSNLVQKF